MEQTIGRFAKRYWSFAVLIGVAAFTAIEPHTVEGADGTMKLLGVVQAACVLAMRWVPFYGALGAFVTAGAMATHDPELVENDTGSVFIAYIFCSFWVGRFGGRMAPAGLVAAIVGSAYVNYTFDATFGDYFWVWFFVGGAWVAGFAIAERIARADKIASQARSLADEHAQMAAAAVAHERQRIARELHDVIAHSVSVMTVQTGAVRRLLRPEQESERQALLSVEETGRQALTEMRRLVGLLKDDTVMPEYAPQPGMDRLEALFTTVRDAGLPVDVTIEGEPHNLAPGLDLTAYRVVQEALTNALKYAGPAHAWVAVRWGADDLELEVANDGGDAGAGDGGGHGLAGMRERVAVYGGELDSGPRDGGGFVVRARLPLGGAAV
jgi:signal transduction histidine kinase